MGLIKVILDWLRMQNASSKKDKAVDVFVILGLLFLLNGCATSSGGRIIKEDYLGSYQIFPFKSKFTDYDYSVSFDVSEDENIEMARRKMEIRAHSICDFTGYLIVGFDVKEINSQYMNSVGGNIFTTYNHKNRRASSFLICNPTSEEISNHESKKQVENYEAISDDIFNTKKDKIDIELFKIKPIDVENMELKTIHPTSTK